MAIDSGNPITQPALTYDKVHIENYSLRIETVPPYRYVVNMLARKYADDGSGNRIYTPETLQFTDTDFERAVLEWCVAQGYATDLNDGLAKKAAAVTAVNDEFAAGTWDPFKLMAYFQLALGLQLEIGTGEPMGGIS